MLTLKLDHLDFSPEFLDTEWKDELWYEVTYDQDGVEHELVPEYSEWRPVLSIFNHPCMAWCQEVGMVVEFKHLARVNNKALELEDAVFATFKTETDAVKFKLCWSDQV